MKFSLCDLDKILKLNGIVTAWYNRPNHSYYPRISKYMGMDKNGKSINKCIRLHQYVLGIHDTGCKIHVDHINHDTLDCRRENLRVTKASDNLANRKGANRNSKTGVRNVNYIKSSDKYWVQIMKNGHKYHWEFPSDKFEEACRFAEQKRKEIFGEYAGNG